MSQSVFALKFIINNTLGMSLKDFFRVFIILRIINYRKRIWGIVTIPVLIKAFIIRLQKITFATNIKLYLFSNLHRKY